MKLKLYSIGDKYSFSVDEFFSQNHYFLTASIKESYSYAWEAYRDAKKLGLKNAYHINALKKTSNKYEDLTKPVAIDASAEEMISSHYSEIFDLIKSKAEGMNREDLDKRSIVYQEIKGIVTELLNVNKKLEEESDKNKIKDVISKFRSLVSKEFKSELAEDVKKTKEQSTEPNQEEVIGDGGLAEEMQADPNFKTAMSVSYRVDKTSNVSESIEGYAFKVCKAIEKKHPSAIYKVSNTNIDIVDSNGGGDILRVGFNKELNMDKIVPLGKVAEIFPINSLEFYQRYWKPIVESVGCFFVKENSILLAAKNIYLPDIPNKCPAIYTLKGFNTTSQKKSSIVLAFKGNKDLWEFEKENKMFLEVNAESKKLYTEEDFIKNNPAIVKCIDPKLKSIYQKTGEVVQVIPLQTHLEIDVDFGRAVVRLTGEQIEIIDAL